MSIANKLFSKNHVRFSFVLFLTVSALCFYTTTVYAQDAEKIAKQKAFEQVFDDAVRLDPTMVEKVKNDTPGKRHYVDKDGDGKPEEVWFIDIEPRHSEGKRPILVKVVDENANLEMGNEPEKYGDLWIADWHADGLVDYGKKNWRVHMDGLRALVATDNGDDNLLDYDIDYVYYQIPCQNHSHFGGNESFTAYYLDSEQNRWIPYFENPFLFYDFDNDGISEEVIRIEGKEELVKSLRWSFNVNPVAAKQRDFDVSISACAKGWTQEKDRESDFNMYLTEGQTENFTIQGIPTGPVLKRSIARKFLQTVTWERVLMTWNENNLNIASNDPNDTIERWEGVINAASTDSGYYMPRIGAPDCGPYNKRYELVLHPKGCNEYYYNPSDHRIHMKHSDRTWIKVDYDYDTEMDMNYLWIDSNNDGVMDRIDIDVDGDGIADDSYSIDVSKIKPVNWTFKDLNGALSPVLKTEPENKYYLVKVLAEALESVKKGSGNDPIGDLVEKSMKGKNISDDIASRLINSDQAILYYLTLLQDSQIAKLKKSGYKNNSFWREFSGARSKGDTQAMTKTVVKYFKSGKPERDYTAWIARLRKKEDKPRVAWNNQWLPPNWGWESEKAAFRFYLGHFDLFGKREWIDTLIMPKIAEGKSYHIDQNGWGMDILHVGKTAGCGGVTLYVNGVAYPVRNETGKGNPVFTGRLIEETNHKVTLEFVAEGVGPENAPYTVRLRPSICGGELYSSVGVIVDGGVPGDKIELGVGLVRLPDETFFSDKVSGVIGSWGFQDPEIGWIGMGVMFLPELFLRFDDLQEEHRVVLNCTQGVPVTYYIRGDWLRGHQFPCCPSAQDWFVTIQKQSRTIKEDRLNCKK